VAGVALPVARSLPADVSYLIVQHPVHLEFLATHGGSHAQSELGGWADDLEMTVILASPSAARIDEIRARVGEAQRSTGLPLVVAVEPKRTLALDSGAMTDDRPFVSARPDGWMVPLGVGVAVLALIPLAWRRVRAARRVYPPLVVLGAGYLV